MKLGIIEDPTNRGRLAKLQRFHTSKSEDKLTSFEEYVGRMKEGQKDIYFLAGAPLIAVVWQARRMWDARRRARVLTLLPDRWLRCGFSKGCVVLWRSGEV
jgi:HSP90 family molecular chaperone